MPTVTESVKVSVQAQDAWNAVLDFKSRPKYSPRVKEVTLLDGEPLKKGSRIRLRINGDRFTPVVEAIEPPQRLELLVKGPGFKARHVYEVTQTGDGTTVAMSATYGGLLGIIFGRMMTRSIHKDLTDELAAIKQAAEGSKG